MMHRGRRTAAGLLVFALALAFGAASALATPSGLVRPPATHFAGSGAKRAQAPAAGSARPGSPSPDCDPISFSCEPPLLYGGGPVMHAATTHVIAWAPTTATPFPGYYESGFETYLADLAQSLGSSTSVGSVAAQYSDANGPALSSLTNDAVITDSDPYPTSGCTFSSASACLTEVQIQAELRNVIGTYALASNFDQSYIVLLPPNVATCLDSSSSVCEGREFCGYHDVLPLGSNTTSFALLPYTRSSFGDCYDGFSSYPAGTPNDLGTLDSIGAHELLESATDPTAGEPGYNAGYLDVNGWEIADECAYDYGPLSAANGGGTYNQLDNGHQYLIQQMWSNQDNNCMQGDGAPAVATITDPAQATGGVPASFSVSLSGPSVVPTSYQWAFLSPSGGITQASGQSPQVTFAQSGVYTVWVQIADTAGGTITGVSSLTVAPPPPPKPPTAAFTAPTGATAGQAVTFSSSSTAGTGTLTGATWQFGDSQLGSGPSTSHIYTNPGQYTVTLTVIQADGLTAAVQHTITVAPSVAIASVVAASIRAGLVPSHNAAKIAKILKAGGFTSMFKSPTDAGSIAITWYATVKHKKVVIARGSGNVLALDPAQIRVKLTAAGRRLLRRSKRLTVTVDGVYHYGNLSVTVPRTFTLHH